MVYNGILIGWYKPWGHKDSNVGEWWVPKHPFRDYMANFKSLWPKKMLFVPLLSHVVTLPESNFVMTPRVCTNLLIYHYMPIRGIARLLFLKIGNLGPF